jgi:hypothetical protein
VSISRAEFAKILHQQAAKCPGRAVASVVDAPQVLTVPGIISTSITVPIRTVNPLNNRKHWRVVHARGECEKNATTTMLIEATQRGRAFPMLPIVVTLVRIGKQMMDSDSLAASNKHIRDAIAKWYGEDDRDGGRIEWRYAQEPGSKGYAVRIEIRTVERQAEL